MGPEHLRTKFFNELETPLCKILCSIVATLGFSKGLDTYPAPAVSVLLVVLFYLQEITTGD